MAPAAAAVPDVGPPAGRPAPLALAREGNDVRVNACSIHICSCLGVRTCSCSVILVVKRIFVERHLGKRCKLSINLHYTVHRVSSEWVAGPESTPRR